MTQRAAFPQRRGEQSHLEDSGKIGAMRRILQSRCGMRKASQNHSNTRAQLKCQRQFALTQPFKSLPLLDSGRLGARGQLEERDNAIIFFLSPSLLSEMPTVTTS